MSATGKNRRTWLCLVAQRWDVVGAPFPEGAAGQEREGLIVRGLRRHVERCPYCQHQVAEWQQVVTWLQSARKVQAPGDLVDRVMGKIALERAGAAAARPVPNGKEPITADGRVVLWRSAIGFSEAPLARGLLAALATHAIVASTLPQAIGVAYRAITAFLVAAERWRWALWEAREAIEKVAYVLPAGLQPYFAAVFWGTAGLAVAVWASRASARWTARET